MADLSIEVEGLEPLLQKLGAFSDDVGGRMLSDALFVGGQVVRSDAVRRAPIKTGNLRASITVERVDESVARAEVTVGPSKQAPYGVHVEYGTRFMAAQPYMRPALDTNRQRVAEEVRKALAGALEKAI